MRARRVVLGTAPTAPVLLGLWNGLVGALGVYDLAVMTSMNAEGQSRSMDFDAARVQVAEWLGGYEAELAATAGEFPADADPVLLQQPMGHFVSFSAVPLRT